MKRLVNFTLMLALALVCISPFSSYAEQKKVTANNSEEIVVLSEQENDKIKITPYIDYRVIDNESIGSSGVYWNQPKGFKSYRVYVTNDTNEEMTVTVRYPSGWGRTDYYIETIPANSGKPFTVNNAQPGTHRVSFNTSTGYISGKISVRVSDESL